MTERALIFGQGPGADVVIKDPYASSTHCRITKSGDDYWVEDLGSTNGTWVVGRFGNRTRVQGKLRLISGERVVIGRTELPWEVDR